MPVWCLGDAGFQQRAVAWRPSRTGPAHAAPPCEHLAHAVLAVQEAPAPLYAQPAGPLPAPLADSSTSERKKHKKDKKDKRHKEHKGERKHKQHRQ